MRNTSLFSFTILALLLAFTITPVVAHAQTAGVFDPLVIAQDQDTGNYTITHMTGTAAAVAANLAPPNSDWGSKPYVTAHNINAALSESRDILFAGLGDWQLVIGRSADGKQIDIYRIPGNWPSPALCQGHPNCTATPLKSVVVDAVLDSI